jgi:hypothetical protein
MVQFGQRLTRTPPGGHVSTTESKPTDVPAQVFEDFLSVLPEQEISADVIARLHQTLLVDKKYTDAAFKAAVFGEEA